MAISVLAGTLALTVSYYLYSNSVSKKPVLTKKELFSRARIDSEASLSKERATHAPASSGRVTQAARRLTNGLGMTSPDSSSTSVFIFAGDANSSPVTSAQSKNVRDSFVKLQKALVREKFIPENSKLTIKLNLILGFYRSGTGDLVKFDLEQNILASDDVRECYDELKKQYVEIVDLQAKVKVEKMEREIEQDLRDLHPEAAQITVDFNANTYVLVDKVKGPQSPREISSELSEKRVRAIQQAEQVKQRSIPKGVISENAEDMHLINRYSSNELRGLSTKLAKRLRSKRTGVVSTIQNYLYQNKEYLEIQKRISEYEEYIGYQAGKSSEEDQKKLENRRQFLKERLQPNSSPMAVNNLFNEALHDGTEVGVEFLNHLQKDIEDHLINKLEVDISKADRIKKIELNFNLKALKEYQGLRQEVQSIRKKPDVRSCEISAVDLRMTRFLKDNPLICQGSDVYRSMLETYVNDKLKAIEIALVQEVQPQKKLHIKELERNIKKWDEEISLQQRVVESYQSTANQTSAKKLRDRLIETRYAYQSHKDFLELFEAVPLSQEVLWMCSEDIAKLGSDFTGITKIFDRRFFQLLAEAESIKGSNLNQDEIQHLLDVFSFVAGVIPSDYTDPQKEERKKESVKALQSLTKKYNGALLANCPLPEDLENKPWLVAGFPYRRTV